MDKEEILRRAQNGKDEREELMMLKAHKLAGGITVLVSAIIGVILLVDGYMIESGRGFDFLTVASMFMGIGMLHNFIFSLHQFVTMKEKKHVPDFLVAGVFVLWALKMALQLFI